MNLDKVEELKKRVNVVNNTIVEKRAKLKVLKEQFQEKMDELEELGVTGIKSAKEDFVKTIEERIKKIDEECDTLAGKIEKAVKNAEEQLGTSSDEIF